MGKFTSRMLVRMLLPGSVFLLLAAESWGGNASSVYNQVLEKLEDLKPGKTIAVNMETEKNQYAFGEPFEARFRVDKACYVVLMNISLIQDESTDPVSYVPGEIRFFLPNAKFSDQKIAEQKVYSTVQDFDLTITAEPPEGYETLNLFCSPEKLALFEADFSKEPYYTIKPDDEERLKKLLASLDQLAGREWSGTSVQVRIGLATRAIPQKFGALPPIGSAGTTGKFFPPIGSTGSTGKTDKEEVN